jgi:hypothetical protein
MLAGMVLCLASSWMNCNQPGAMAALRLAEDEKESLS